MPVWQYQGGTHLYEYNSEEFTEILYKNFEGADISAVGLDEVQLPYGQWGTDIIEGDQEQYIKTHINTSTKYTNMTDRKSVV